MIRIENKFAKNTWEEASFYLDFFASFLDQAKNEGIA